MNKKIIELLENSISENLRKENQQSLETLLREESIRILPTYLEQAKKIKSKSVEIIQIILEEKLIKSKNLGEVIFVSEELPENDVLKNLAEDLAIMLMYVTEEEELEFQYNLIKKGTKIHKEIKHFIHYPVPSNSQEEIYYALIKLHEKTHGVSN